ncbi:MAG: hypothetical protein FD130_1634 [Halothiobacillaceae bacterium]|nr:MAG: hypothetical protein FD130_1634 [Halothiobacillaceae bacterium]
MLPNKPRQITQPLALLTALMVLTVSPPTFAHKLNVFAYMEENALNIEGYFADGKKARNSSVKIYNPQREMVAEGTTNEEGIFKVALPSSGEELRIVVNAGMGHQSEYRLAAAGEKSTPSSAATTSTGSTPSVSADLGNLVEAAVTRATAPLQREIAELKTSASLSDIIGGIGFILGALGLFAFLKAKKQLS